MKTQLGIGPWLAAGSLAVFLMACPPVPSGNDGGVEDAGCAGQIGCECAAGACSTGECIGGACVDCRRGEAACACRTNNTCNTGLRCTASTCQTCTPGEVGCPCGTGDSCGTGLICAAGLCVADTCSAGTASCPCRATDPKCDGTQYCDGTLCQACSNDVVGCACAAGVCTGSTVCEPSTSLCRAPVSCADLRTAGSCLANQACVQVNGADATCTPMACDPQYQWNGTACVVCVSADCLMEPSCALGDGGLGDSCATNNRACGTTGAVSACGACLPGFTPGAGMKCEPSPTCGAAPCALTDYCDTSTGTPQCLPLPCATGSAQTGAGACQVCSRSCMGPGLSGRVWPFRASDGTCVCETLDGFYFEQGSGAQAVLCDADNDGWVREEAEAVRADVRALRPNSRCAIRGAERVRLVDEYGLSIDVVSCIEGLTKASLAVTLADGGISVPNGGAGMWADGGLLPLADGGMVCSGIEPLLLLETQRNDIPSRPMGNPAPAYGLADAGRLLEANELNSLTKACVTSAADYNDNQRDDISEVQTQVVARAGATANRLKLESFSYFTELESSYFSNGVLVIQERTRCEDQFPVKYLRPDAGTATESWSSITSTPYWRTCSRSRDTSYDKSLNKPGYDFGQYSCDATTGGCPLIAPASPTLIAPTDPTLTLLRNHGLCTLGGAKPADGLWRGLSHHSQYKCVVVSAGTPLSFYERQASDFGPGTSLLTFNTCAARPCATPGDPSCSTAVPTPANTPAAQTRQPVIDCAPNSAATAGWVGFAAVNYRPGPNYTFGCVNEDNPVWAPYLCPSPEYSLNTAALEGNYGRYSCYGKSSNFLWADVTGSQRATLYWAPTTGASVNNSVWAP